MSISKGSGTPSKYSSIACSSFGPEFVSSLPLKEKIVVSPSDR
jgi:hypothetical protein